MRLPGVEQLSEMDAGSGSGSSGLLLKGPHPQANFRGDRPTRSDTSANLAVRRGHQGLTRRHYWSEGQGKTRSVQKCLRYPFFPVELSTVPPVSYTHLTLPTNSLV